MEALFELIDFLVYGFKFAFAVVAEHFGLQLENKVFRSVEFVVETH